jgi:two-component system, cell cycle sensor histidine kinase and response regulator CckA
MAQTRAGGRPGLNSHPPESIRLSEELRTALDAIPDPIGIHSAIRDETGRIVDFRIDFVNKAMTILNDIPAEQLMRGRMLELVPTLRQRGLFDEFVHVVETGEPFEWESVVYDDPNDAAGPISAVMQIRAVKFGDGHLIAVRDITANATAQAQLRASEARYHDLVERSADAVYLLDAAGGVVEANIAGEQLLGYAPGALVGCLWEELITPEDLAAHPLRFTEQREGRTLRFERELRSADGATIPVEVSAKMLPDGGFLHIARDIRERKAAEAALRRANELVNAIEATAQIGGWELDLVHDTLYWGAETYRIHETSPAEYSPTLATAIGFYAPESIPLITAAVQDAIERGTSYDLDLELITAAGRRISVRATGAATREQGRTTNITGAFQDITDRKRLEAQLSQSQRLEAVGQLAGGIAHDFNNLLTAIRGYAELARRGLEEDEPRRDDLDQVIASADRAAALIRQLLAFSRRQVLQSEVLDPGAIVEGVAPLLRRLLGENVELATPKAPGLGGVKVDPSQLEQVIVNLAVNARDAMPDGGKLTIELSNVELHAAYAAAHTDVVPGPYVLLAVSDTGTGMDADTRAHAFEPFFTTKEVGKGTGMGLATVYGIVKQSGGSINVYSEPGHGTTFRIYLPRVAQEPTPAVAETPAARPSSSCMETILLAEDEPGVRSFARRTLEEYGYRVLEAAGGAEALTIAASHAGPIALLVTDVVMPGLQGHHLAAQLTATRPELRVLYVSGFTENSVIHHGVPDHGVAFLAKPFSADALGEAVRAVLDEQAG